MRIRLLGTGTPTPSLRRMSSGYLVEIGNDALVLDHGFGAHHRLLELGVPATRVSHLLFTHLHYDHCGDYARLVLTRWDQGVGRVPELKVFGPPPLARMTDQLFSRDGVYGPDLSARTHHDCSLSIYEARGGTLPRAWPQPKVRELAVNDVIEGDGWHLKVGLAEHFSPYLATLAFRIEAQAGSLVYSGDSGPIPAMRALAEGADVLIHMCHYRSGTALSAGFADSCMGHMELAHLAADAGVRNLVTTHITEQFDKPGARERVIAEMSSVYHGNLFFGEDLMEVPISGPVLAKLA
ncbi:MAG: MBL fold metallo-hydrolase [Hyphomicrobiaceae bacterium]|nr:MAG: MBL fold metallo-hydrolase [Hyphomicrobiaceae bacterium]